MNRKEVASLGGKVWAKTQRDDAIKKYYENPIICKECGKIIEVKKEERVTHVKKKKFCDRKCASIFNGNRKIGLYSPVLLGECKRCNKPIHYNRIKSGGFTKRKYCPSCRAIVRSEKYMESVNVVGIGNKTKGELFKNRKNWQSARSAIRKHARNTFFISGKEYKCEICSYSLHIEVCHKKAVSDFSVDTKIKDINAINNLVGFCENHHWEFDNGYLIFDGQLKKWTNSHDRGELNLVEQ